MRLRPRVLGSRTAPTPRQPLRQVQLQPSFGPSYMLPHVAGESGRCRLALGQPANTVSPSAHRLASVICAEPRIKTINKPSTNR